MNLVPCKLLFQKINMESVDADTPGVYSSGDEVHHRARSFSEEAGC